MKLNEIMEKFPNVKFDDREISGVSNCLENIVEDSIYIAKDFELLMKNNNIFSKKVKEKADILEEIKKAKGKGATFFVIPESINITEISGILNEKEYLIVKDIFIAEAAIVSSFYSNPSVGMNVVAISGSNNLDIVSFLVKGTFDNDSKPSILFSQRGIFEGNKKIADTNVKDNLELQKYISEFKKEGYRYIIIEFTPEMLDAKMHLGISVDYACITGFDKNKVNKEIFKSSMEYISAIQSLIEFASETSINNDDFAAEYFKKAVKNKFKTIGIANVSDYIAKDVNIRSIGTNYILSSNNINERIELIIPGKEAVYCSIHAICALRYFNVSMKTINNNFREIIISGKKELLKFAKPYSIMIDESFELEDIRETLKEVKDLVTGRIVVLVSDDGILENENEEEVKEKRKKLGEMASKYAGIVVCTTRNSRNENPNKIINEIADGVNKKRSRIIKLISRKTAVKRSLDELEQRDLVIIFGLGNDGFVEIENKKVAINEREIIENKLKEMDII